MRGGRRGERRRRCGQLGTCVTVCVCARTRVYMHVIYTVSCTVSLGPEEKVLHTQGSKTGHLQSRYGTYYVMRNVWIDTISAASQLTTF